MKKELDRCEWDFKTVFESTDINFVRCIRDWELTREVWHLAPELLSWIFDLREEKGDGFLKCYQEELDLRAGLWTISTEFPERAAMSLGTAEIEKRIRTLLPVTPLSKPDGGFVQKKMGNNLEKLTETLESGNVTYHQDADAYLWDNSAVGNQNTQLIFPVCVDLDMSRKAIVESFGLLLDEKLERLGTTAGHGAKKGRATSMRVFKDDLRQLAAFRLRKHFEEHSGRDWWIDAAEMTGNLYSAKDGVPWDRAAAASEEIIRERVEEVKMLNPNEFCRREIAKLRKKAAEIGIEDPFPE